MNKNNKITQLYSYLSILVILCTLIGHSVYAQTNDEPLTAVESQKAEQQAAIDLNHHTANEQYLDSLTNGALVMRGRKGDLFIPAVLMKTQASVDISGPVAQTVLTQEFYNNRYEFIEGVYVFPLPDNAAVDYMEISIGQRRIVGNIMEKQAAKKVYEAAKREGKRSALVEQQRPNLFRTSVANIPANETIKVTLRFSQRLQVQRNHKKLSRLYEYRLPLTFTPRFHPHAIPNEKNANESNAKNSAEWDGQSDSQSNNQITSSTNNALNTPISSLHLANNNELGISNPLDLTVRFNKNLPGVAQTVKSIYHPMQHTKTDAGLTFRFEQSAPMNRDFVLQWQANPENSLDPVFYTESIDGEHYGLLLLSPPHTYQRQQPLPREVIYIIDSSGSMGGTSMQQAKQSLLKALDQLTTIDRFNIIDFDSVHRNLFVQPKLADHNRIKQAKRFVQNLDANGGTNMAPALESALSMPTEREYLKQIIFITDGAVSNEQALFTLLHQKLGNARLFTVGIGSAPNSYFMRKAAEFGRGSFTFIGSLEEVDQQMTELFNQLENPVLQNLALNFNQDIQVEQWPTQLPDLYAGQALVVPMKFNILPDSVRISGKGEGSWQQDISIHANQQHPGIAKLWARNKIQALMDSMARGKSEDEVRPQVINVALTHKLMSQYTSFVAVEETPIRPNDHVLKKGLVPNLTPKGQRYPQTALGLDFWYLIALIACALLLLSSKHGLFLSNSIYNPKIRVLK